MSVANVAPPTTLGFDSAGLLMTGDEFDANENWEEGYRYELFGGALIVSPHPSSPHNGINDYLGNVLYVYEQRNTTSPLDGTLFETYLTTGVNTRRCVDRAVWTGLNRDPNPDSDDPTIVVEIVSAGKRARQRDYEEKRDEYLAIGVREYWIVDRFDRTMTVFHSTDKASTTSTFRSGDDYSTDLLPGFVLNLKQMFDAGEKWESKKS